MPSFECCNLDFARGTGWPPVRARLNASIDWERSSPRTSIACISALSTEGRIAAPSCDGRSKMSSAFMFCALGRDLLNKPEAG
jgi:hypothetical protein